MDSQVIELTDENFEEEVFGSSTPMLVEFFSESSYAARELSGIFDQLAEQFGEKARMGRLDMDVHWQTAESLEVKTSPTVLIVQNGKVIERMDGVHERGEYQQAIHELVSQYWVI